MNIDLLQTVIVPLVVLLMTPIKALPLFAPDPLPDGPRRNAFYLPWIAAVLGAVSAVVWTLCWPTDPPASVVLQALFGFILGLAAAGGYDAALQPIKKALMGLPAPAVLLAAGLGLALAASGCMSIILPTDKDMLHRNALNAAAINAKVQAVQPAPAADGAAVTISAADWAAIRVWWAEEARAWWAIDLWAQGKDPAKNTYVPWSLAPPSAPAKEGGAL